MVSTRNKARSPETRSFLGEKGRRTVKGKGLFYEVRRHEKGAVQSLWGEFFSVLHGRIEGRKKKKGGIIAYEKKSRGTVDPAKICRRPARISKAVT